MEYRRLGRTQLQVSVIGFGTCQLRLTPEKQAIDTLLKGFDLGVNIVHTAPDYGNTEEVVARAARQTGHKIIAASQGYDVPGNKSGPVFHFERLFETTCERLGTERLDLYGIACIDDREAHQENVWSKNGMVEFLLKKKEEGRLRGIFCTTHGKPEYVRRLVTCGVFDAIVLAYNILGYHLLTCNPPPDRHFESLPRNQQEIFPLCREHDVGLMIMKPLGGGLLCESNAFPPRHKEKSALKNTRAGDILRSILLNPEVACVLPGTASVAEAEGNAYSGYAPIDLGADHQMRLKEIVKGLKKTVCSRCGACDTLCSQGIPISWIFRAGLINLYPAAVFEQPENIEYFRLHPQLESVCAACPNMTCACPDGINIPQSLKDIHSQMVDLMGQGLIPPPDSNKGRIYGDLTFAARIVSMDIPKRMEPGKAYLCRLQLENAGKRGWLPESREHKASVVLGAFVEEKRIQAIEVTQDVHRGSRWHFLFEITAPRNVHRFRLRLQLLGEHQRFSESLGPIVFSQNILVGSASCEEAMSSGTLSPDLTRYRKDLTSPRSHFFKRVANKIIRNNIIRLSNICYREKRLFSFLKRPLHTKIGQALKSRLDAYCLMGSVDDAGLKGLNSTVPPQPYDVAWLENNLPASFPKGEPYQVYLHVKNRGSRHWHARHPEGKWVELVVYIGDALHSTSRISRDVAPGESLFLTARITFPNTAENGKWRITFSFVERDVAWFHRNGMDPLVVEIRAEEPEGGAIAEASAVSRRSNWGFWQPSQGITRSRTGCRYPLFIEHAQGCRVRDPEGNEWIDYVMAGGSAILGYAHPEIRDAVSRQLDSSAVVTLPHMLEIKVTEMLRNMIPCAEMVLFGKHGSDMCTAAIRIARLHTGRKKVLFSGYHGWHDWYAETLQPKLKVSSEPSKLFRFELSDLPSFRTLVKEHSGEIAAVILEPAAQAATLDGPVCDADPAFLRHVAQICRRERCVLIFDEIVTGFRHPQGSVQAATGVIPDMACLGKALSAGMPLSALVGRREIMQTSLQAAYMPTFRGEVYSLAAAAAALQIYQSRDVPGEIHDFGLALKNAINLLSRELNVQGEMIGVPFRMLYRFHESDELQRSLKRTLLQQELLQRGILTFQGYMLPSTAHGEMELEQTISAFRGALKHVQEVSSEQAFVRYLDIPLI
jgi:glutamate-1-semialdehyde aminotransferase/predicted aldo/keto reductase-like oxidoreductase